MSQHAPRTKPAWLLPLVIGVLALLVVILGYIVFFGSSNTEEAADPVTNTESGGDVVDTVPQDEDDQIDLSFVERHDAEDPLAIGPVDAPVTMVVFADYQCPFCASWSDETLPVMMEYVEDDQVRIEWRDVNVFGPESEQASKAAYAAALQDKFWEYHGELYANGEIREPAELSEDALIELADELGLDTEQFAADMSSDEVTEKVEENQQLGHDIGAYSTPAFVLNGEPMVGAQPTEVFVDAMDAALKDAQ